VLAVFLAPLVPAVLSVLPAPPVRLALLVRLALAGLVPLALLVLPALPVLLAPAVLVLLVLRAPLALPVLLVPLAPAVLAAPDCRRRDRTRTGAVSAAA
jgi:hypothetical protein